MPRGSGAVVQDWFFPCNSLTARFMREYLLLPRPAACRPGVALSPALGTLSPLIDKKASSLLHVA